MNLLLQLAQVTLEDSFFVITFLLLVAAGVFVVVQQLKKRKWAHRNRDDMIAGEMAGSGEITKYTQDFFVPKSKKGTLRGGPVTGVLTNNAIHFFQTKTSYSEGMGSRTTIPLAEVGGITAKDRGGFGGLILSFVWQGKEEELLVVPQEREGALRFIDEMRKAVSTRRTGTGAGSSVAAEIEKLSKLAGEGILTQEELTRAKEMFIGKPASEIDESVRLLRNLKDLHKQGVLSESEFNMKKWDVLAKKSFS
jgi:hypothetical protein